MAADPASPELVVGVVLFETSDAELARLQRSLDASAARPGTPSLRLAFWDNSATDACATRARARFPGSSVHGSGENLGFGAGHNRLITQALATSSVRAYLCLNPDALLDPDCLAALEAEAQRGPPGLVEARLFPDEHRKPYHQVTHETPWASGTVLRIDRATHQRIGGFDEGFFMYCEDVDLSWRARAAGLSVRLAPDALAHHATLRRAQSPWRERMVRESSARLGFKYGADRYARRKLAEALALGAAPFTPPARASRRERQVARFKDPFTFVEPRW